MAAICSVAPGAEATAAMFAAAKPEPLAPLVHALSACLVLVSTALAFWIPARRAAGIDPMAALRQEY